MLFVSVGTEDTVILPAAYVPEEIAIWLLELGVIVVAPLVGTPLPI